MESPETQELGLGKKGWTVDKLSCGPVVAHRGCPGPNLGIREVLSPVELLLPITTCAKLAILEDSLGTPRMAYLAVYFPF